MKRYLNLLKKKAYYLCNGCISQKYSVSQKSSPPKTFAVFSFLLNLYNGKLSWLLPKHISMSTPILVHLSKYLCEMYHFTSETPSVSRIQFNDKISRKYS